MRVENLKTYLSLGLGNIATVFAYRMLKKFGYYRRLLRKKPTIVGPYLDDGLLAEGSMFEIDYFSYHIKRVASPPNWFENYWNSYSCKSNDLHWSEIPDFMPDLGDIKIVWELSRFDWLPKMAWRYKQGDKKALARLETWLRDWMTKNPPNTGINWKCGQEASFRTLNMLLAAQILGKPFLEPTTGMLDFLDSHMLRVAPTIRYAVAQDNNHGTSEAIALFVVGYYLSRYGDDSQRRRGKNWLKQGRYWIENRVARLILDDGSFSQHSVTYHRLMLDSISYLELFRRYFDLPKFSLVFYKQMSLAVSWLQNMIDESGDAPNIGANDGAYIFNFKEYPYRDFRPSLELGAVVFLKRTMAKENITHPLLALFNISASGLVKLENPGSKLMASGGYCRIKGNKGFAVLRLPKYLFRPSHADGLHLDIWHRGENIIRDAGSFSYNTSQDKLNYYSGTRSHSTVVFDNRNQMPQISRFLFSNWLEPSVLEADLRNDSVKSGYVDYLNARHTRHLIAEKDGWIIVDEVDGFTQKAEIYWRLAKRDWELEGMILTSSDIDIEVSSEIENITLELVELPESRYYLYEENIPVLIIISKEFGKIKTSISFKS